MKQPRIHAVAVSFCKDPRLVARLEQVFPCARINRSGTRLNGEQLIDFLSEADGIIVGTESIDENILKRLPRLKIISKYGVGLDSIDLDALKTHNIKLGWTPGVNRRSVSELVLGFILGSCRNIFSTGMSLKSGRWHKDGGVALSGKTVGIIGCGNIGSDLIQIMKVFGCRILINDVSDKSEFCRLNGLLQVELDDLIRQSDIISLHVPLLHSTRRMVGADFLSKMKRTAILINTSRGEVVDQRALKIALSEKRIAAACLDVYEDEPLIDEELVGLENFWGTPHIGGNAKEAVLAMGNAAIDHLVEFFAVR